MQPTFNLAAMPLVLCGPILRKVYYNSVSVWLVFKEQVSDVTLEVFDAAGKKTLMSGTMATPLKLGKSLFMVLVTAESSSPVLQSGIIYGYKISFKHRNASKSLGDQNVLGEGKDEAERLKLIAYKPYDFPTFCLPGNNPNSLKITHGSCRKPHGGNTDALRALDTMIEMNSQNATERPQLLCLTGDQIYADDVADILLYKIREAMPILLGWNEKLPKDYLPEELSPGARTPIVAPTGNKVPSRSDRFGLSPKTSPVKADDLTTSDSRSHLIFLGEYLLMYLFNYSACLYYPNWPSYGDVYKLAPYTQPQPEDLAKEMGALNEFVRALPFVRKALANISCLMIFDDHDVTDDFFISKEWCEAALTPGSTSRRYVFNGLLAYAICQDWGNDPEKYKSGKGAAILKALQLQTPGSPYMVMRIVKDNYLKCIGEPHNPYAKALEDLILPKLEPDKSTLFPAFSLNSSYKWDYRINYHAFDLFVLNTRTERQFFDKEKPLGNLAKRIERRGPINPNKLAVVVSAAPVFGNISMEINQEKAREGSYFTLAGVAGGKYAGKLGMYEADQEAWTFSNLGYTQLLFFLSGFKKVLILSGDVHYAFTSYIRLWRKSGSTYQLTEIVQSVSSSLKNSTEKTHFPAINKYGLAPDTGKIYKMLKILNKADPKRFSPNSNPRFTDIAKLLFGNKSLYPNLSISSLLQFNMQYIKSPKDDIRPILSKLRDTNQAKVFRDVTNEGYLHDTVIGKDNISLISFTPNSITNSIWFASGKRETQDRKESERMLLPFARHRIVFNPVFKKEEIPEVEFLSKARNISVTATAK